MPEPRPGLVIRYAYLWANEQKQGHEEGSKDRPCAVVAARRVIEDHIVVTVLPISHRRPDRPEDGVELPAAVKSLLGMDELPSWVIVAETNDFLWPGPDLRPIPATLPRRYHYGMLPPRFYAYVRDRVLKAAGTRQFRRVERSE